MQFEVKETEWQRMPPLGRVLKISAFMKDLLVAHGYEYNSLQRFKIEEIIDEESNVSSFKLETYLDFIFDNKDYINLEDIDALTHRVLGFDL